MYRDDPARYTVFYRDKDTVKNANLKEFVEGEEFSPIPLTRIVQVSRDGSQSVWKKGQKELIVKKSDSMRKTA